jgi:signal transduction histidine kinase
MESPPSAPVSGRLIAALTSAAVVAALTGAGVAAAYDRAGTAIFAGTLAVALAIGAIAVVGAVITLTVPGNRVGWLLLASAALLGIGGAFTEAGIHGIVTAPGSMPGAGYLAAIGPGLQATGLLTAVVAVPAVFPDGHLPGPHWRWLAWCTVAAMICLFLGNVVSPHTQEARLARWHNPLGLPDRYGYLPGSLSAAGVLLAVAAAAAAVAGLAARWRRGGPHARQQLLLLALAACPPALVLITVIIANGVPGWVFGVVLLPVPIAIAFAILGRGLYDLRRAAHQTLLWLAMSGTVVGIYALLVTAAVVLVPYRHGWWPAAAAAIAALLLIPLRATLQRAVTRVVYGRWHEPYEVLADLGERLEAAADVDRLLDAAVAELTTGLGLAEVSIRGPDGAAVSGAAGAGDGLATTIPLLAYGVPVGELAYRPPGRPLSAAEQRLVRDLARHLGGALHARLLREDLQRARERLVLAREEERRRLRRDLHDGIGPALAGLTLKTETTRALLPPGTERAARQLHALGEEIRRTVLDVRRLVEGLRPPALDELGLAGACTQAVERLTVGTGLTASVDTPGELPTLPAAVEVAAYRIMVEAVTNTVRHAHARHCQASLALTSTGLSITVIDDGTGLAANGQHGNGLAIMRERAEELGGTVTITDATPGVKVDAHLPAAARPAQPSPASAVPA